MHHYIESWVLILDVGRKKGGKSPGLVSVDKSTFSKFIMKDKVNGNSARRKLNFPLLMKSSNFNYDILSRYLPGTYLGS